MEWIGRARRSIDAQRGTHAGLDSASLGDATARPWPERHLILAHSRELPGRGAHSDSIGPARACPTPAAG
ncbi:MAG: hypothetical protein DI564_06520 [Rhodanobacter denitrificans]|uniref:Uncharacterized protein n=1 Tax=Rhodanobacter denitrificans TaxID=666685 RepID=A0A2W5M918_9GAMM|nr:MAG: hypothetical protein DI564_06520 [Rhodanobacter denitrificans]